MKESKELKACKERCNYLQVKVDNLLLQKETLQKQYEDVLKEVQQLKQHRIELTRSIQAHGRIYQNIAEALRALGLSLEHSEPAKFITSRHMED